MGAEDPGTDDSWFGDDTGYTKSKAEKESGMKVAEDTGSGWTKADNPPGLGPLGLVAGALTMGASLPVSLIAGKAASFIEEKAGLKNIVDVSMLGGTTKQRAGGSRPRGLIDTDEDESGSFFTASKDKDQRPGYRDPEGSPEQSYSRSVQMKDSPTSPAPTQVAERDELEEQFAQARRGRAGRRSLLSPGNVGSGYLS
jgi:hypothetical protein